LSDDGVRRRLSIVRSVEAQIERELVTDELWRRSDGATVPARIVRIGFRCNQACRFCFVSTHLPAPPREVVAQAIVGIAHERGVLVLSGGEPTLDARLAEWIALGKAEGAREIELQTNATRLDDGRVAELVAAGLDTAFVSLHGATAATSDAITDAPDTFVRTVAGLDALARAGVRTRINFVFCTRNVAEFPAFVDLVASRWPTAAITVSFVAASTDLVPRTPDLVPRYTDVMPALVDGLARARAHGLEVGGFDSMCGIPLCLVPGPLAQFFALAELGSDAAADEFTKPAACTTCALQTRCFGLRRGYAELHGASELRPVSATV
jgi:pyruvate-formate lyase-activating enzyme